MNGKNENKNDEIIPTDLFIEFKNLLVYFSKEKNKLLPNKHLEDIYIYEDLEILCNGYARLKSEFTEFFDSKKRNKKENNNTLPPIVKSFIDGFNEDQIMPKSLIASLCEKSQQWVYDNVDNFKQCRKGVYTRSFLMWLKDYNLHCYNIFKTNYEKH